MKKIILPLSILLLTVISLKSQNAGISPSPNSSALCSSVSSVNLYTGVPSINLPLYKLQTKEFSLPISLSYNASGIKVEQVASWVGLGWSLNAGGVVTRVVNGSPDDVRGCFTGDITSQVSDFNCANNSINYEKLKTFTDYSLDTEPDLFYFNFCGISGKFIFDKDKKIQVIPYKNLEFEYTQNEYGELIEFKIVDNNGVTYIFSDIEVSTIKNVCKEYGILNYFYSTLNNTTIFNSSWYLSQIITHGSDTINFSYADESYVLQMQALKTYNQCETEYCNSGNTLNFDLTNYMDAKRLSRISTNNIQIDFIPYCFSRIDLSGSYSLWKILIYSKTPDTTNIPGYKFNYTYFSKRLKLNSVNKYYSDTKQELMHTFSYYEDNYLPSLTSGKQDIWGYYKSSSNTLNPKLYIYPEKTGSERFRVYPIPDYSGTEYILHGSDRLPDPEEVKTGTLKKIHHAIGGYTEYKYEPHTFYYDNANYEGGGLRIKKITEHDGNDHANDKIKNYYYTESENPTISSGRLINKPIFAYPVNDTIFTKYGNVKYTFDSIDYNFDSYDYYYNFLKRFNIGQATLGNSQNIGYLEVKEVYGETDNNTGYKISRFSLPGDYTAINDNDGLYQKTDVRYISSNSSCEYYLNNLDFTANTFPFPPNTNYDWNRGIPLWTKYYNSSDLPVKEINYSYELFYKKDRSPIYIFGLKIANMKPQCVEANCNSTDDIYVYGKYKYITNVSKLCTSVSETNYTTGNEGDISKAIVNTKTYSYNQLALLTETSTIQSDGSILKKTYKHPSDIYLYCDEAKDKCISRCCDLYDGVLPPDQLQWCLEGCNTSCDSCEDNTVNIYNLLDDYGKAIYKMRELHIESPVIESFTSIVKNGTEHVTFGGLTKYKEFSDSVIRAKEVLSLKTSEPISSGTFREANINQTGDYEIDENYTTDFIYDNYDEFGNLIQAHKINNVPTVMFWGYNNSLPIIKALGATYSELETAVNTTLIHADLGYANIDELLTDVKDLTTDTTKQQIWKTFNTILRASLPNAKATTHTYKPLIGKTSETNIQGLTTYYYYDDFGRLETIKDDDGNIRKHVKFQKSLTADFTTNNPAILNEIVWFTAYDDMPGLTYFWDFGDGSTGTDRIASHTYGNIGYYNVTLTISAPIGSDIVKTKQVKVDYPKLEAIIIPLGLNFTCPDEYKYTVEAEGGTLEYTYEWYINEDSVSSINTISYEPAISNNSIIKCIVNDGNSTITVFYDLDYPPCP